MGGVSIVWVVMVCMVLVVVVLNVCSVGLLIVSMRFGFV